MGGRGVRDINVQSEGSVLTFNLDRWVSYWVWSMFDGGFCIVLVIVVFRVLEAIFLAVCVCVCVCELGCIAIDRAQCSVGSSQCIREHSLTHGLFQWSHGDCCLAIDGTLHHIKHKISQDIR